MTNRRALEICSSVVDAINTETVTDDLWEFSDPGSEDVEIYDGSFWFGWGAGKLTSVLKLDYDSDGEIETLGRIEGHDGTCLCAIADLGALETIAYPGVPSYRYANGCDRFMTVNGEPIIISGGRGRLDYVNIVSWLSPEGEKQPLCYLGRDPVSRVEVDRSVNGALCRSVVNDTAEFLAWSMTSDGEAARAGAFSGSMPGLGEVHWASIDLDIDLDGKGEKLGLMRRIETGGCMAWELQLLDSDMAPVGNSPLNGIRQSTLSYFRGDSKLKPRPMLFRFRDEPYILGKEDYADAAVIRYRKGRLRTMCEFSIFRSHHVKTMVPFEE